MDRPRPAGCLPGQANQDWALFDAPTRNGQRIGSLELVYGHAGDESCDSAVPWFQTVDGETRTAVPSFESGYEVTALAVLERQGEWVRLALAHSTPWLLAPEDFAFEAYPALLVEKLAYATPHWSGELCRTAGGSCRTAGIDAAGSMAVVAISQVANTLWLQVEVSPDVCQTGDARVLARGWIRAYSDDGHATVWFHSRGC
ncbi:MAG: hypothetical protein K0M70_05025 [Arenimonas sp.]|uniref:hypothetical protein n=1 Tax=Arenimonas sp. TaxID=1872635 RepID=UPI0025C134F1|nr:hypothetical protein [Arenimonas sp.]MBW8367205.1 hypothetical protein [Arenimonas sp.]